METIYSTVHRFEFDPLQILIPGLFLFAIGFWAGQARKKKLERKVARMEREIRDLNSELLYK